MAGPQPNLVGTVASPGNADALLKNVYLNKFVSTLNEKQAMLKKIGKDTMGFSGRQLLFPVMTAREGGVGARSENSSLPRANASTQTQASIEAVTLVARAQFSKQLAVQSRTDIGAFARGAERIMKNITEAVYNDSNRQVFGVEVADGVGGAWGGTTGLFGTVTATANNQAPVVSSTANIEKGMSIAFGTKTELQGSGWATAIVTGITSSTVFTTDANVDVVAGDGVVRGDADGNSYNQELTGLNFIVNATVTLQGLTVASHPSWVSTVTDAASAFFMTDEKIQLMIDTIGDVVGDEPDMIACHRLQRRLWLSTQLPNKRYTDQNISGGFSGKLTYSGGDSPIELFVDKHCPSTTAYFLNSGDLKQFIQEDWKWMDDDGAVLSRVQNKANFEATMTTMRQLGCYRRNSHGKYTSLATS